MTQQVFRNPFSPTFYLEDILTPVPGGVDATFRNLTVTGTETVADRSTIASTSLIVPPLTLDSLTGALVSGLRVRINGVTQGSLSVDSVGNRFSVGTPVGSTASFGLFTAGTERLRLPAAGLAVNTTATGSLAIAPGDPTIYVRASDSGTYAPIWATLAGWTAPALVNFGIWQRNSNVVTVTISLALPSAALGANTATITLPVGRISGPFTGSEAECCGDTPFSSVTGAVSTGFITGTLGSSTTATITVSGVAATVGAGAIRATFSYTL